MKDKDSYVFPSERKPNQKLQRERITLDVNKVTHSVSKLLPVKSTITSRSFRIDYISQLCKHTKDIEFVRQTIGHRSLNSTSGYVSQMDDQKRQNHILSIYNYLSTSYLTDKPVHDLSKIKFLYQLVQLLNYMKSLENSSRSISMGDRTYKIFQFPINNFLEFTVKSRNNYYQIKRLVEFFKSLQRIEPIMDNFSDGGFRGYIIFPYVKVERKKSWHVELSVCQELCSYRYPFHLPETFFKLSG